MPCVCIVCFVLGRDHVEMLFLPWFVVPLFLPALVMHQLDHARRPQGQLLLIVADLFWAQTTFIFVVFRIMCCFYILAFFSVLVDIVGGNEQSGYGSEVHYAHLGGCLQRLKRIMEAWPARI